MFWSFCQFEKAPECKQERCAWCWRVLFIVFFFIIFDARWLIQTHIPLLLLPHIITHKEFDIHLRKVATQREAGIASLLKEKADK